MLVDGSPIPSTIPSELLESSTMSNQINTTATLVKLVAAAPMLAKVGTLEAAAEGYVKDHPSRQVARAMSEEFTAVNYKKDASGQPLKENLIRTLVKQLNEVLAAKTKPAPKPAPKAFNLADYLAEVEAAPVAAPVAKPAAKPARKLTPEEQELAEFRRWKASQGKPVTAQPEAVAVAVTKFTPAVMRGDKELHGASYNFKLTVGRKNASYKLHSDGKLVQWNKGNRAFDLVEPSEVLTSDVRRALVEAFGQAMSHFANATRW
jgi:hypothetical protein